ncbi:MAG: membrane protein insertase YidC [Alphaproteobacteria bacterium]|nr:membrane protein insertase YidC [Alphaproteobacteria bacterium]
MGDNKNLIIAIVVSLSILLGFQFFYEAPRLHEAAQRKQALEATQPKPAIPSSTAPSPGAPGAPPEAVGVPPAVPAISPAEERAQKVASGARIKIVSPRLAGSIALQGGRLDDLTLSTYRERTDQDSPPITLFSPASAKNAYYAEFGWSAAADNPAKVPDANTLWTANRTELAPQTPVTLSWSNDNGLTFERVIAVDDAYVFTITERVTNRGVQAATLFPWGLVSRAGTPSTSGFYILHEGPLGVFDGTLSELSYGDVLDKGRIAKKSSNGGWIGLTDKYWLTALVPDQKQQFSATFNHQLKNGADRYQIDFLGDAKTVPPGGTAEVTSRLFAGAKEVDLLERYAESVGIPSFDKAIDFGWFYFLTKPLFKLLAYFNHQLGNFGLAILLLTVIVKLIFFPLANKSYKAMSAMKKLQPEMMKLRERFGEDRQRMNQELMALYKREKANPLAGCLPIAVQIPVFFALYKVMFVTIEMRHAPFYGWIHDLSAQDPTSLFNLFGLIPWDPPNFLHIGIWPIIMGGSMFLQQKLNPTPPDPIQAKMFMLLPLFFTFLLANFPAGLVIYWTWNNVLSIAQQWVIMKREGVANPAA